MGRKGGDRPEGMARTEALFQHGEGMGEKREELLFAGDNTFQFVDTGLDFRIVDQVLERFWCGEDKEGCLRDDVCDQQG